MTTYRQAKREFLTWLAKQAKKREVDLNVNATGMIYHREPDVLARLRATNKKNRFQTRNTEDELSVNDELNSRFNEVLCVILQISDPPGFNPHTDHFYPLRVTAIERNSGEKHSSGEYQLNFDLTSDTANHFQDDLSFALGLNPSGEISIKPSGSNHLQEIARDVCRDTQDKND